MATPFVIRTDHNARGQRLMVEYGNGVTTASEYDPATFRVLRIATTRGTNRLQDLRYTYDAGGNITHVEDDAEQALYFANAVVDAHADYVYDAVYRLVEARGREHIGQLAQPETTWDGGFRVHLAHPQDGHAMRRYTERYEYDAVGNVERLVHQATNADWTRRYTYAEASQLEPGQVSNRLSTTVVGRETGDLGPESYPYDAHGNVLAMAHLPEMRHDFRDRLVHVDRQGGGEAFYVYDQGGQRARKVVEKNGGALVEERIYLGSFELFRRRSATATVFARETLHVSDDRGRVALVETKTLDADAPVVTPTPRLRFQHTDVLGSGVLELDESGQTISYEEYYPYGGTAYQAVAGAVDADAKRYRYAGMERDEETGFNYHAARYYAPWMGRWLSADPMSMAAGVNLYAYCRGNPVMFTDPNGRDSVSVGEPGDLPATATLDQIQAYASAHGYDYSDPGNTRRYNPDTKQWIGGTLTPHVYDPAEDHPTGFGDTPSDRELPDDSGIVKVGGYKTGGGNTGGDYDPFAPKTPAPKTGGTGSGSGGSPSPNPGTRKSGPAGGSPTGASNGTPGGAASGTAGATGQTGDGSGGGGEEASAFFTFLAVALTIVACLTIAGALLRIGTAALSIGLRFALTVQAPAEVTAFGLGIAGYNVAAPGVPKAGNNPALTRAYETQGNSRGVDENLLTRTITAATGEETFNHTTVSAVPPRTPQSAAVSIVQGKSLNVSPGGQNGQWGEGAYAYEGPMSVGPNASPQVQFRVPAGTGIERIQQPGQAPIVRLVPSSGTSVPLVDPQHNLSADEAAEAQKLLDMLEKLK
jgi:RHS repeat-associated protein